MSFTGIDLSGISLKNIQQFMQTNSMLVNTLVSLLVVGLFLRLSAPFLRGVAEIITALKRNSARNEILEKAAQKQLEKTSLATSRDAVHSQKLTKPTRTARDGRRK